MGAEEEAADTIHEDPHATRKTNAETDDDKNDVEETAKEEGEVDEGEKADDKEEDKEEEEKKEKPKEEERTADHKLDFDEYIRLLPGRMKRVRLMEDRIKLTRRYANDVSEQFDCVREKIPVWMNSLRSEGKGIEKLAMQLNTETAAAAVK